MMAIPTRELDQRHAALAVANDVRHQRADLKRFLRSSTLDSAAFNAVMLVETPPTWAATMKARNLLVALPGIGDARADRALIQLRINPRKTLAGLSDRQRDELITWLSKASA